MRAKFAQYIGVDSKDMVDDDIPIVAIAASGGGQSRASYYAQITSFTFTP
jgi:hypothetical protein